MHAPRRRLELRIGGALFGEVAALAAAAFPYETGGIILGQESGRARTVSEVIGPGPNAEHRRASFDPDQDWQVEEVARLWRNHEGKISYLGDWHSHPGGTPKPSRRDREVLRLIADADDARCAAPVMLILAVGTRGIVETRAYQWRPHRITRMQVTVTAVK
jgi:integrative and conjugative element protein (TIGR02256 family)